MKNKGTKIISLFIILAMLLAVGAFAAEQASYYIGSTWADMDALGDGELKIELEVIGTGGMTDIGASKVYLYEKATNSTRYRLKTTFSHTYVGYDYLMAHNTGFHDPIIYTSGTPGYSYYVVVDFYAADNTGNDTVQYETDPIICT